MLVEFQPTLTLSQKKKQVKANRPRASGERSESPGSRFLIVTQIFSPPESHPMCVLNAQPIRKIRDHFLVIFPVLYKTRAHDKERWYGWNACVRVRRTTVRGVSVVEWEVPCILPPFWSVHDRSFFSLHSHCVVHGWKSTIYLLGRRHNYTYIYRHTPFSLCHRAGK